jgi:protein-tyrosine phosphatase
MESVWVLFVCTGNICRSPTAEGVFRRLIRDASREKPVAVDSAGTHDYHAGQSPDRRATEHALRRGYDISGLRARQLSPPQHHGKLKLFLEFSGLEEADVPDPCYGGAESFEQVLDMVEAASRGLLDHVHSYLLRVST